MADTVIKTFDLYNTSILLPGYSVAGYENEFGITKAFYSTDFSSNPIGSKIDFFGQLNDPCAGIYNPNPVFTVPVGLTTLNPLWLEQWWNEAMFYSHPLVLQQLKAAHPGLYQDFSDSVGTLYYVTDENSPVSPAVSHKVPKSILNQITSLNNALNYDLNKVFKPAGFGANTTRYTAQLDSYNKGATVVKSIVTKNYSDLKTLLPLNTIKTGNLITPPSWGVNLNLEGVKTRVDRLGNIIGAPQRLLSGAINKVKSLVPKLQLPSLSKLVKGLIPGMPAGVSNTLNNIKTATSAVQGAVATAQGAVAAAAATVQAAKNTIGAVKGAVDSAQFAAKNISSVINNTPITNIIKNTSKGGVSTALRNQSSTATTTLTNNTAININTAAKTSKGDPAVVTINTFTAKK
jgi:DNA uptake protein ComE-like DNA-binding protein